MRREEKLSEYTALKASTESIMDFNLEKNDPRDHSKVTSHFLSEQSIDSECLSPSSFSGGHNFCFHSEFEWMKNQASTSHHSTGSCEYLDSRVRPSSALGHETSEGYSQLQKGKKEKIENTDLSDMCQNTPKRFSMELVNKENIYNKKRGSFAVVASSPIRSNKRIANNDRVSSPTVENVGRENSESLIHKIQSNEDPKEPFRKVFTNLSSRACGHTSSSYRKISHTDIAWKDAEGLSGRKTQIPHVTKKKGFVRSLLSSPGLALSRIKYHSVGTQKTSTSCLKLTSESSRGSGLELGPDMYFF
ncbi:hypothetical protein METBIDRAFT_9766 [Metschnikowia bicuspidata var. bicuspidata NRRL YB-4993]|uniref:Uncharacterized protein n=1 Tax=Metschnikowia bicuspidata var. bicuspidata NRRL YB-4993 TaxID=869754 RepID=A0A1A0HI37_9ASCO|nr:hypothetical protein METBIDRAFT_9766 [Metschnikowia bicuspidata var. bicuspidata NRRL YB-4993]OBA23508.1 hypothetical protein METBIDRAFT_9766 [Metschnikowia bicuspidata var. bicuspidata NRRL YB-4993]